VNFGVDLDSRVALVGPNGAGKHQLLSYFQHHSVHDPGHFSVLMFYVDCIIVIFCFCYHFSGKTTLVKLMASELQPTLGDIRPHGHLKIGRFTQHFVDVLDLEKTPLEFFESLYPNDPREEQRKYLGRFGVSGSMQVQKMSELSDGQKSRVVFAKLGRDVPHIVSIKLKS
jgi:ATP-binding cassette subfamily F protein 2